MGQLNLFGDYPTVTRPLAKKSKTTRVDLPDPIIDGKPWNFDEFLAECTPAKRRTWKRAQQFEAKSSD